MLNQEYKLPCGVVLKNRLAKSAMSENMGTSDLKPNSKFEKLYARWAKGGSALVITGNVMIDSRYLGEPNNVVIEEGHECLEELSAWAKAGTQNGAQLWMQINHPGKQSPKFLTNEPVSASAIPFSAPMNKMFNCPRELTTEEIKNIIGRYAYTAKCAKDAGFSGVQIHGAHGYLVSQFLSPKSNQRSDEWGGSLENRMRFVVEIYMAMREVVGNSFPVGIKINSADFQKGGFTQEESMEVVKTLGGLGMDLIEISGGTYEATAMMDGDKKKKVSTVKREAFFLDYCEKVRTVTDAPLLLTGGFRSAEGMNAALESKACDFIGMARALAIDPEFAQKILTGDNITSPVKRLSTGLKAVDSLIPIEITWYTQQLHRIGKGMEPVPNASVRLSVLKTFCELGIHSLKRVRSK